VVLSIGVVGDIAVVQTVEQSGHPHGDLEDGGQPAVLGQSVLVVPAPVSPGHGAPVSHGVVELAAEEPGWELVHLHLAKGHVSLAIEDGRVVGAVDGLVITWGKLAQHV